MSVNIIAMGDGWARREHFEHFYKNALCSFSFTVNIDISVLRNALKTRGIKLYPALIFMLSATANRFPEFRMELCGDGSPGYFESVDPLYTVLSPETGTFSAIHTPFVLSFDAFYEAYRADTAAYATGGYLPQGSPPPNVINISCVPWLDFTAFNLNLHAADTYLLPIFTIGKYSEENGRTLLPLAVQIHHAACDGIHAGRFVESLRHMAANPDEWL